MAANFHAESLHEFDEIFDPSAVIETITRLEGEQAENAFLLIIDGKCEGILFGIEISSLFNKKKIFQEMIWYINQEHRSNGIRLLKYVQGALAERGFNTFIMALMENSHAQTLGAFYERMGFKLMERNYVKSL